MEYVIAALQLLRELLLGAAKHAINSDKEIDGALKNVFVMFLVEHFELDVDISQADARAFTNSSCADVATADPDLWGLPRRKA